MDKLSKLLRDIVKLKMEIHILEKQKSIAMAKFAKPVFERLPEGSTNGDAQKAIVAAVKNADKSDGLLSDCLIDPEPNAGYHMFYEFMGAVKEYDND